MTTTAFNKDDFSWDGMYLNYQGEQGEVGRKFEDVYGADKCHPSRIGTVVPMFIARFKYGSKPYKTWINFICKHFTVEEWFNLADRSGEDMTPDAIMKSKGFLDAHEKKLCKKYGLAPTVENLHEAYRMEWENN